MVVEVGQTNRYKEVFDWANYLETGRKEVNIEICWGEVHTILKDDNTVWKCNYDLPQDKKAKEQNPEYYEFVEKCIFHFTLAWDLCIFAVL